MSGTDGTVDRSRGTAVEAGAAIAVGLWRMATQPPTLWWRDWILVVAAFWLFSALRSKSPAWPTVMASLMAYLLGIYVLGQGPHVLTAFGLGR